MEKPQPPAPAAQPQQQAAVQPQAAGDRLAGIYGPVVARLQELTAVIADETLTVAEKLERLDALAPIRPDATAEELAMLLGCHKSSVTRSPWWQRRKGEDRIL